MSGDNVSLELIGAQMTRPQADIRDLNGCVLLVESDDCELRRDIARLETKLDVL